MHNKIAQKLLSITVSAALMTTMVPLGRQNFVAEAAETTNGEISKKIYATPDDLVDSNIFSLAEENDEKVGKINFGTRKSEIKYYDGNWKEQVVSAGAMTWLIAGSDGDNRLVLYSEEPMMSAKVLDVSSDSRFQTSYDEIHYDGTYGSYSTTKPENVYSNHWGASNLRKQLTNLYNSYFAENEKKLVEDSTITTYDAKNGAAYTTKDKLYAPLSPENAYGSNVTAVSVGENATITIDKSYWGSKSWLRSPFAYDYDDALYAKQGDCVLIGTVDYNTPAIDTAFAMNLDSVIFSSAAIL